VAGRRGLLDYIQSAVGQKLFVRCLGIFYFEFLHGVRALFRLSVQFLSQILTEELSSSFPRELSRPVLDSLRLLLVLLGRYLESVRSVGCASSWRELAATE